jgi:hypothetical protein
MDFRIRLRLSIDPVQDREKTSTIPCSHQVGGSHAIGEFSAAMASQVPERHDTWRLRLAIASAALPASGVYFPTADLQLKPPCCR